MKKPPDSEFERAAQQAGERSVMAEFVGFLRENKKWWLLPLLALLLLLGTLVFLSGTGFAPFIYTLF